MTKERPRETGTRFDDRDHEFITSTISYRTGRQEVLLPIDYSHYSFLEKQMIKLRIIFPRDYKFYMCLLRKIAREITLLLVNNVHEKHQRVKTDDILKACTLFVICTRVKTLHSCYIRMHSFSANQKRVIR